MVRQKQEINQPNFIDNLRKDINCVDAPISGAATRLNVALANAALVLEEDHARNATTMNEMLMSPMWQLLCAEVESLREAGSCLGYAVLRACVAAYIAGRESARQELSEGRSRIIFPTSDFTH